MKLTGYLKSIHGRWGPAVGFAPEGWDGGVNPVNAVYVTNGPSGTISFCTYVDRKHQCWSGPLIEDGKFYKVEIVYANGKAEVEIGEFPFLFRQKSPILPAPTVALPEWRTDAPDFHRSWTEIPEIWLPAPPWDGPPLAKGLNIKWPWQTSQLR